MTNLGTVTNINLTGIGANSDSGIPIMSGNGRFRFVSRGGRACVDEAITVLGFAGVESADQGVTGDWVCQFQF